MEIPDRKVVGRVELSRSTVTALRVEDSRVDVVFLGVEDSEVVKRLPVGRVSG